MRSRARHWNLVQRQSRRRAESIDRCSLHGVGNITRRCVARTRDSMSHEASVMHDHRQSSAGLRSGAQSSSIEENYSFRKETGAVFATIRWNLDAGDRRYGFRNSPSVETRGSRWLHNRRVTKPTFDSKSPGWPRHSRHGSRRCDADVRASSRTYPDETSAQRRMRASTRSMTSSGVEVPAVSPTTLAESNHSWRTSPSVCT